VKTEKRLIVYSIVALMVGVASIVPLTFLMPAKAETTPKSWFNLNVPYAYVQANFTENLNGQDVYEYMRAFVFNFTLNPETENEISDARFEYYELQLYTDKEQLWNVTIFVGTNRTNSVTLDPESFRLTLATADDWFDSNTTGGGVFTPYWNKSSPPDFSSIYSGVSGSAGPTGFASGQNEAEKMVAALGEAETFFVDIRKIGLVTFNANSTLFTLPENEFIQHLELKKYGDGFLYNALFSEDQLAQIDLLHPYESLNQQKT
jgi:hypothetical protein